MARAFVGISGWRYASWRGDFYPKGLRQKDELHYVSERLPSAELNGSFYSLQRPSSYEAWRDETTEGFVFAVKGGRFITHMKQLRGIETPLANFFASGVLALGTKLGPILWQLPERLEFDRDVLTDFIDLLPRSTSDAARLAGGHDDKVPDERAVTAAVVRSPLRHALEPRHESFDTPEARAFLAERGVSTVVSDSAGRWPTMHDETGDFRYVRLHGEARLYGGGYQPETLDAWAKRVRDWLAEGFDTYVYFDNDADGRAPYDAVALLERLG